MNIVKPSIRVKSKPLNDSSLETEGLFGEKLKILDKFEDWVYVKLLLDNYCGWVKRKFLGYCKKTTHRVIARRTFIYKKNDAKSDCINYLPLGSKLSVKNKKKNWAAIYLPSTHNYSIGYVPSKHLIEVDEPTQDWVTIAEQLLGTPYKWGGRDSIGIDCSALLQISYEAYGQTIPRNSVDQIKINKKVISNINDLSRGSVIFWEGHVGIMVDRLNCIHANGHHMETVVEPLNKIILRMGNDYPIKKMMDFNT